MSKTMMPARKKLAHVMSEKMQKSQEKKLGKGKKIFEQNPEAYPSMVVQILFPKKRAR